MAATVFGIEWAFTLTLDAVRATHEGLRLDELDRLAERDAVRVHAKEPVDGGESIGVVLARLQAVDPISLDAYARVSLLKDCRRVAGWVESRTQAAVLAIAGSTRRTVDIALPDMDARGELRLTDTACTEIALAMRIGEHQAQTLLHRARLLFAYAPATRAALAAGTVQAGHAAVIAEGISRLAVGLGVDDVAPVDEVDTDTHATLTSLAAQLDTRAAVIASRNTIAHTRSAVARIVDRLDAAGAVARRAAAAKERGIWVRPEADGNALLMARLALTDAIACASTIRHIADNTRQASLEAGTPDHRGISQLRADALTTLILSGANSGGATGSDPSDDRIDGERDAAVIVDDATKVITPATTAANPAPLAAHIDVVITLDALLGLTEQAGIVRGPGIDEPIPAAEVRDLFTSGGDITLRRLVTDPLTGHLLDATPRRYRPSQRLREFITGRDQRCRIPGCTQRATNTDLDHATPYDDGGLSVRANLGALCRRHHLAKTHTGLVITDSDDDGGCIIITPSGHSYRHQPVPILDTDDPPPF